MARLGRPTERQAARCNWQQVQLTSRPRQPWEQGRPTRPASASPAVVLRARVRHDSGASPRITATAIPTSFLIWCSMKLCPTTTIFTHRWPLISITPGQLQHGRWQAGWRRRCVCVCVAREGGGRHNNTTLVLRMSLCMVACAWADMCGHRCRQPRRTRYGRSS